MHARRSATKALFFSSASLGALALGCSGSAGEATAQEGEAVVVGQGPNTLEGVDVSHYQGSIDWGAVKASGRAFGVASVGDGTYEDPMFDANWSQMKAAGIVRGAYQFFEPAEDPIVQADILLRKMGTLGASDLSPTLDVEATGGQSGATISARIQQWADHVKTATGRVPIIYTGKYFWNDNVGSTGFSANPLWIASYGVAAPDTPNAWSTWKIWQYSSTGSVPGIGGNVDVDRFDGTMADLLALTAGGGQSPVGYLDSASCEAITGWSQDPAKATSAIDVHVFFNAPEGAPGAVFLPVLANVHRPDLCAAVGSCDHGFSMPTPRGLKDGKPHEVRAYGLAGTITGALSGQKSVTCAPPKAPFVSAVKRHVVSSASFKSWRFSSLLDVAHYSDAEVKAYANGDDIALAPELVQADDGTPEVWIIDGMTRRHITDPASLAAWRFDAASIKKTPSAAVYARAKGQDWPRAPFLIQGSTPDDYVLDGVETPKGAPGAGAPGDAPAASPAAPAGPGGSPQDSSPSGGCTASAVGARDGGASLLLLGVMITLVRRRRLLTPG